jgi:hypothetical protein
VRSRWEPLLAVCVWALLGGCAGTGRHHAASVVEPAPTPLPTEVSEDPMPPPEPPTDRADSRTAGSPARRPSPVPQTVSSEPDTLPPPMISVQLSPDERVRLAMETEENLAQARQSLGRLGGEGLTAAQMARVETLHGLIDAATAAREKQDLQAAAQLARKARLLADQLVNR